MVIVGLAGAGKTTILKKIQIADSVVVITNASERGTLEHKNLKAR